MKLGFLTAPFPETPLMEVADWAAASGFEVLEIACWPRTTGPTRRYAGTSHIDVVNLSDGQATPFDHTAVGGAHPAAHQGSRGIGDRRGYDHGVRVGVGHGGVLRECTPPREAGLLLVPAHLVLPEQSTPLKNVVSSTDYTERAVKAGHIGLSVGSRAHKEMWPGVCAWLAERSDRVK